jgi:uncharacterized protein YqgC (DUF456 family)
MLDFANSLLITATLIAMGLSLILMIVIPVLPGQFLIWLAAVVFGWLAGWEVLGWTTFAILTALMLIGAGIDWVAGWVGARKGGASWPAIAIGLVLGLIGLIIFNAFGAVIGVIIGIAGYEYYRSRDWQRVRNAAGGYLLGQVVSLVARLALSITMVLIFVGRVS